MLGYDRDRLLKLLALMESDSDGEALAAARQASRLLRQAGLGWADIIKDTAARTKEPESVGTPLSDIEILDRLIAAPELSDALKGVLMRDRSRLAAGKLLSQQSRTYVRELYANTVANQP